jgi:hypothetical protein
MKSVDTKVPHKLLIVGVISLLFGLSLLLKTTGYLSGLLSLWPVLLVLLGMSLLYRVFFKGGYESYVFAGLFLVLVGAFILILNTGAFDAGFRQIWPLFMLFAGVSLFAYGMKRKGNAQARMIIPSVAIIFLSLIFLLFSLRIVSMSFRRFVVTWWPVILVAAGVVLIGLDIFMARKKTPGG